MKRTFLGLILGLLLVCGAPLLTQAGSPSDGEKLRLKSTVVRHIEAHTENEVYLFVKNEDAVLLELSFVAMHPVVFSRPDGIFVLCADFEDGAGRRVLVDYYVRKVGDAFTVLSSIEGKRSLLTRMAEKFRL